MVKAMPEPNDVIAFMDCYGSDRDASSIPNCTIRVKYYKADVMYLTYVLPTEVDDDDDIVCHWDDWQYEIGTDWRVIDHALRLGVFIYE